MEIVITLKGKVIIQDDELQQVQSLGKDELANLLCNNGREIKTDVREVYVKEGK